MEKISHIVATGRGATHFKDSDRGVVENAVCIARGLSYLSRSVRTVVDLGEQSIRTFRFAPKERDRDLLADDLFIPHDPQTVGALGAALIAENTLMKRSPFDSLGRRRDGDLFIKNSLISFVGSPSFL